MSGKSNSVSGNYTCKVGLVQTQLRCKTRREGCKSKSTGFLSASSSSPRYTVVLCNAVLQPPIPPPRPMHTDSSSLSLSLSSFCPPVSPDKTAAAPSVWEDKKSPLTEIAHLTLPPAVGKQERQPREKRRDCRPHPALSKHQLIHEMLHEYIHYMLLKSHICMKNTAPLSMLRTRLLNPSIHLRK